MDHREKKELIRTWLAVGFLFVLFIVASVAFVATQHYYQPM